MDLHKSIRAIHTLVVSIFGETEKNIVAYDKDEKKVAIDWTKVKSWQDPNEYQYKRADEYPCIVDQLDDMYHNGFDKWKETIKKIKDKYPKE